MCAATASRRSPTSGSRTITWWRRPTRGDSSRTSPRWAGAVGADWSLAACGFPLPVTHVDDPASSENRAAWTRAHLAAAHELGALHYQWFNVLWERTTPALDYRIETDVALSGLWATRSRL